MFPVNKKATKFLLPAAGGSWLGGMLLKETRKAVTSGTPGPQGAWVDVFQVFLQGSINNFLGRKGGRNRQTFDRGLKAGMMLLKQCILVYVYIYIYCSRMRSEGFSFNSGGLGVEPCSRPVVSMFATVRNRPQVFAVER